MSSRVRAGVAMNKSTGVPQPSSISNCCSCSESESGVSSCAQVAARNAGVAYGLARGSWTHAPLPQFQGGYWSMPNVQTTRQPHPSSISTRAENPLFPAAWAASTAASIACSTVLYGEYSINPRAIFHIPLSGTIRYSTQDNGASQTPIPVKVLVRHWFPNPRKFLPDPLRVRPVAFQMGKGPFTHLVSARAPLPPTEL